MGREMGAAFVVTTRDGLVLAVSRGPGGWNWTLPGGRREKGETLARTALRELEEETGMYAVSPPELMLLSKNGKRGFFRVRRVDGQLRSSHEGDAAWVPWDFLIARGGRWSRVFAALAQH